MKTSMPMIGPPMVPMPADDDHEDHHHRPVVDAEPGLGRDAELLQEDQPATSPVQAAVTT